MLIPAYLGHHPGGHAAAGYLLPELPPGREGWLPPLNFGLLPPLPIRPSPSECRHTRKRKELRSTNTEGKCLVGFAVGREWQEAPPQSRPVGGRPRRMGLTVRSHPVPRASYPTQRTKSRSSWSALLCVCMCLCACICVDVCLDNLVDGDQGRDPVGGFFRVQVRAAPHVLPPDLSTGKLGKAAGKLRRQNPRWAHDPARCSLGMDKVEPQTDRCRQSPGGAAGVAGAEVRSSSARVRESRVPKCPKSAGEGRGCRRKERPQSSSPPRAQAHPEGDWGGGRSIWGRSYTATHPRPLSPPTAPPLRPRQQRAAPPLSSAVHTVLFQQNNTTHRPQHPHRAGSRATPSPPPAAPRAPSRVPAKAGRRAPAVRSWGERWSLGSAAQLDPAPPPIPGRPK